jgi:aspartate aminotransferase-like enzyme
VDAAQPLTFRIATQDWEFEAIHRLNYRTFVEEIPQHEPSAEQRLVDRFHDENTYAICLDGDRVVGMVCGRSNRPFSLDQKLPGLDTHLLPGRKVIEVRLLAVERPYRNGLVFAHLCGEIVRRFRDDGFDLAVITGTTRQTKLYRHLGFVPFGPELGTPDARFQPMYLTLEKFLQIEPLLLGREPAIDAEMSNFLPGPVGVRSAVREAFGRGPVSHRSGRFMADFRATRRALCELVAAADVQIMLGSGTLANDAIGAQIQLLDAPGLVLSQGEFGERLVDLARGQRLDFEAHRVAWGEPFDLDAIRERLDQTPGLGWLWLVHCETSTGILNDLPALVELCAERSIALCVDGISSIGTVPVDLGGVYLASAVSGKGLGSYAGLAVVFHDHPLTPAPDRLPRYLDLGYYAAHDGVPFTVSSNLVHALRESVLGTDWPARFSEVADVGGSLRSRLEAAEFTVLAPPEHASPAVLTVPLPEGISSKAVGRELEAAGYLLSYGSAYLLERNWIQVCLMGDWTPSSVERLPDVLTTICHPAAEPAQVAVARA